MTVSLPCSNLWALLMLRRRRSSRGMAIDATPCAWSLAAARVKKARATRVLLPRASRVGLVCAASRCNFAAVLQFSSARPASSIFFFCRNSVLVIVAFSIGD
jgi:hypothetical protein